MVRAGALSLLYPRVQATTSSTVMTPENVGVHAAWVPTVSNPAGYQTPPTLSTNVR